MSLYRVAALKRLPVHRVYIFGPFELLGSASESIIPRKPVPGGVREVAFSSITIEPSLLFSKSCTFTVFSMDPFFKLLVNLGICDIPLHLFRLWSIDVLSERITVTTGNIVNWWVKFP